MNPHPYDAFDISVPASAVVLDEDRGALPYRLVHGESLVAAAAWAVGESGADLVDQTVPWSVLAERGDTLLLHDALCPMTPPAFLARCAERAAVEDVVVVGVRPVTDTVKEIHLVPGGDVPDVVGASVDRDALVAVCSPVVLPPAVVVDLFGEGGPLPSTDLVELVALLRERYGDARIELAEAPPQARRVASEEDIAVLAALTARE
jgi:2-C-methyl-D-erythritol 4-phosphate cytidylyltransferase